MGPHIQNNLVCAKCKKLIPQVAAQFNPHAQMVQMSFSCHGERDTVVISMMELQQGGSLVVFAEFQVIKVPT